MDALLGGCTPFLHYDKFHGKSTDCHDSAAASSSWWRNFHTCRVGRKLVGWFTPLEIAWGHTIKCHAPRGLLMCTVSAKVFFLTETLGWPPKNSGFWLVALVTCLSFSFTLKGFFLVWLFSAQTYLIFDTNSGMDCMLYCSICCIFVASNLEKGHYMLKKFKGVTENGPIWL